MSEVTKKSDTSSSQMRLLGGTPHMSLKQQTLCATSFYIDVKIVAPYLLSFQLEPNDRQFLFWLLMDRAGKEDTTVPKYLQLFPRFNARKLAFK